MAQTNKSVYEKAEDYIANQDYDKAISFLDKLAKRTDSKALYMLGNVFELQRKIDDALLFWTKAAEQGFLEAQYSLASHYYYDKEKQNYWAKEALQQYIKLANNGDSNAMVSVGKIYGSGWLEEGEDWEKAVEWYDKAVTDGNTEAMEILGTIYWGEHEIKKSFSYYLKGAKKGDLNCRMGVGQVIYNYGKEYPELVDGFSLFCTALFVDDESINPWYYKAANMGSPHAEATIGWWMFYGDRYEEAKLRLEKAKNEGMKWITTVGGYFSLEAVLGATYFFINNPTYQNDHYSRFGTFIDMENCIFLIAKKNSRIGIVQIDYNGKLIKEYLPFKYDRIDCYSGLFEAFETENYVEGEKITIE